MSPMIEEVLEAEVAAEVVMPTKQQLFARSLRELADMYDAHPELNVPEYTNDFTIYNVQKADLPMYARAFGKADKLFDDYSFQLRRDFGNGVGIRTYSSRESVCQRVKVGEEVVPAHVIPARPAEDERVVEESVREVFEWRCPGSILAGGDDDSGK